MQTYTTTAGRSMPKTPATAKDRVRHLLTDIAVRPPDFVFCIQTVATGRHLDRVVVSLPHGSWHEGQEWFTKLCPVLPWSCRVTLIPEIGRIEIEPRGH